MKMILPLLALSLLSVFTLSAPVSAATVLLDQDFSDGSKAGWYTSRASSDLTATAAGGGSMTSLIGGTTTQLLTYFTGPGDQRTTLEIGETLQITVQFSLSGVTTGAGNPTLRFGVFDSGNQRINADEKGVTTSEFNAYRGYAIFGSRNNGLTSAAERTGNYNVLLVDGTPWSSLGTFDRTEDSFSFQSNVKYTLTISIRRTAETEVDITSLITFGDKQFEYTLTDSVSPFVRFDTFALAGAKDLSASITLDSVLIQVIPEPGTTALFSLVAVGLLFTRFKRRQASIKE